MKNLKIRFIKIGDKYTMEFKRFGLWVRTTVPNKDMIYSRVMTLSKSKCLKISLYLGFRIIGHFLLYLKFRSHMC